MKKSVSLSSGQIQAGINYLLLFSSVLTIILMVVIAIVFLERHGDHRRFVTALEHEGRVAIATVDFVSEKNNWVDVYYQDEAGQNRYGRLEMHYYPEGAWEGLERNAEVEIRYLPESSRHAGEVVLADRLTRVRTHLGHIRDLLYAGAGCLLLIIYKPQPLFFGFVEGERLIEEGLRWI